MGDHQSAVTGAIFVLAQLIFLAAAIVVLVVRARGRGKRLAITGCVVLLVAALARLPTIVFLPAIVAALGGQLTSIALAIGVSDLVVTGLGLAGTGLLVAAVVVGSNRPDAGVSAEWGPSSAGPRPR